MTLPRAAVLLALATPACHLFVGVTPCLDDKKACAGGEVCDATLGICTKPAPPPPPPEAPAGSCGDPLPLTLGVPATGDTTGLTGALKSGNCQGGDAAELVYGLTLDHDAHLHAEVKPAGNNADLQLYARHDDCTSPFQELGCGDEYAGGVPEQLASFDVKAGEPVFLVVDGFNIVDVGAFTLTVVELDDDGGACDPADAGARCPPGEACVDGTCSGNLAGETCDAAIALSGASGTETGDTSALRDDYQAGAVCVGPSFTTPAADLFYVVHLPQGAVLDAALTPADGIDQGLYLVDQCPTPADGACAAFIDDHGFGGAETLSFTNSGADADFYLVVDGFTETQNGAFTLDWSVTSP